MRLRERVRARSLVSALLLGAGLCQGPDALAILDEIQVYTDDLDYRGEGGLELHLNTTPSGRRTPDYPGDVPPYHGLRITPEFSWGLGHDLDWGLYLPTTTDAQGHYHLGGAKLAGQLAAERPMTKVLFVSGYAENTVLRHGAIDVTNSFLQKPFSLKALALKIRQVLQTESAAAASTSSR